MPTFCARPSSFFSFIFHRPRRDHIYVFFFPPRAAEFIGRSSAKLFISRAKCVLLKTDPGLVCAFDEFCVRCMNYFMGSCHASRPDKAIKCFNVCVWPNGETPFWCTRLMSLAADGENRKFIQIQTVPLKLQYFNFSAHLSKLVLDILDAGCTCNKRNL
jgi:hypothetical protein